MSHVEQSVICPHCQKTHSPGFIWNFSDKVRVCFTCYRVMGEEGRKSYERDAARGESRTAVPKAVGSKPARYAMRVVCIFALLAAILATSAYFFYKPLTEEVARRMDSAQDQISARR